MNPARSETYPQRSPKSPEIRLVLQHNDEQSFKPDKCLEDLENLQLEQRGDKSGIVVKIDLTGFALEWLIVPGAEGLADLFADVPSRRV